MPMAPWQLEKIRSTVGNETGDLRIKIYTKTNETYKIFYNDKDNVPLYGREIFDDVKKRERAVKAWREEILRAINAEGTKIVVEYKGRSTWFGPEPDMTPLNDLYDHINNLTKTEDELDHALKHVANTTRHRSFLIFSLPFSDGTARINIAKKTKSRDTGADILRIFKAARDRSTKAHPTENAMELHLCIPMENAKIHEVSSKTKKHTIHNGTRKNNTPSSNP